VVSTYPFSQSQNASGLFSMEGSLNPASSFPVDGICEVHCINRNDADNKKVRFLPGRINGNLMLYRLMYAFIDMVFGLCFKGQKLDRNHQLSTKQFYLNSKPF
jgi:hypothetical protein